MTEGEETAEMTTITRRGLLAAWALAFAPAAIASTPSGGVVLTVRSGGKVRTFEMAMLEAMPKTSFVTSSPWTEDGAAFEGVAVKDLIAATNATETMLTARALNDYSATWPVSEAVDGGAIVAYRMNGNYMSVRHKGPLWIVYPFDDRPELKTESNYSRCVWQLAAIDFTN